MITNPLTYEQKQELYRAGRWACSVPWIYHEWEEKDWIAHIDAEGQWG